MSVPVDDRRAEHLAPPLQAHRHSTGLSLREVIAHVSGWSFDPAIGMLIDTIEVCVRLSARREMVCLGLSTQNEVEKYAHLASGRPATCEHDRSARVAVEAMRDEMQARMFRLQAAWHKAGQQFTQRTRLLPSELSSDICHLPVMDSAQRRALSQAVMARGDTARLMAFEQARERCLAAQKRRLRAANDLDHDREAWTQAQVPFRAGGQTLVSMCRHQLQWQRHLESWQQATADRVAAQYIMQCLAE